MDVDLAALFDPHAIAVIGASADPAKWGHILGRRALESCGRRPVALVNPRVDRLLGRPAYPTAVSAGEVLGALDLAVVCVPATALLGAVTDAVTAGARAVVAITAGLAELGEAGARLQRDVVAVTRSAGAVLVGPNCLGIADTGSEVQLAHALLPPGEVAVLSQSGNLVLDLADLLAERGLGVSRFVSLGNQADLGVVELMRSCVAHTGTRAVAIYAEDVVDGRGFVSAARALADAGKPVALLSPGRSVAAARSTVSHTGSMTSPAQVVDAACADAGVHRVENPGVMADLLAGLVGPRRLGGSRIAVLTDGGGHGAMAADAIEAAGLQVPPLDAQAGAALRTVLWESSVVANPVDLAGAGDRDPRAYAAALTTLLADDGVDGVLMTGYFGGYSTQRGGLHDLELVATDTVIDVVGAQDKPLVVHTMFPDGPSGRRLRAAGVPVHRDVDRAALVLAGLLERPLPVVCSELIEPAAPATDTSYEGARALFSDAGVPFPAARNVRSAGELDAALDATGLPVVLKALGAAHKSDAGGVVLGLRDADAARAAYDDLIARIAPAVVSVEAMADLSDGVELIVGCVRDRTFGLVLMVGVGGVHAELLADTARALAPVSPARARGLLLSLRLAPLLTGFRGSIPVDLDAVADLVSRVSHLAAAHPELTELELNPVLASSAGVLALDARIVAPLPAQERAATGTIVSNSPVAVRGLDGRGPFGPPGQKEQP